MQELRRVFSSGGGSEEVLFVYPAGQDEGEAFFAEFWPEARAVSDPDGTLSEEFDVQRGSLREIFGPGLWLKFLKEARQRPRPGWPVGDIWRMPGMFLIDHRQIVWSWKFRNIGDHPDFDELRMILDATPGQALRTTPFPSPKT